MTKEDDFGGALKDAFDDNAEMFGNCRPKTQADGSLKIEFNIDQW